MKDDIKDSKTVLDIFKGEKLNLFLLSNDDILTSVCISQKCDIIEQESYCYIIDTKTVDQHK